MPRRARAWGAAVLAPVLLLPAMSTPAHADQEPDSDTPAVSTTGLIDDQAALTLAAETGEPVEITAATTETTRHLANPDGGFTMEQSALPVRVRDEDGWTPVDTGLVAGADGALRPKAAVADIVFSGGGDRDLVSIGLGSNSVALGWHEDLPAPVVDGDQATYPDVLPDVDLVMTAGVDGFGQVLVVHTPEAAEHPDLAELQLALSSEGVTVHQGANGNLDAVGDQGGQSVFTAVAPAMWDSAGVEDTGEDPTLMAPASARTELLDVDVTPDAIRLVPDRAMLTDTATEYPVYIDPSVAVSRVGRTYVDAKYPSQSYWNYPTSHDPGVGYEPQDGTTKRAFWRFSVDSRTVNATITDVTFRARVTHAYGCGNAKVELWRTNAITSSTTWNSQTTAWKTKLDTETINAGRSTCPGGASPTVEFNATAGYVWSRDAGNKTTTLGLRGNETKSSGNYDWRRFDHNPTLQVDYNNPPEVPVQVSDSHGGACSPDPAKPRLINETRPTFTAYVRDRDSTSASRQKVKTRFAWWVDGVRIDDVDSPSTDVAVWNSGSFQSARATALPENVLITYKANANDGTSWSGWTGSCYLMVNTSRPDQGPAVASTDYPAGEDFHGSPGLPGEFTFSNNGVDTAQEYHYGFNDDSCTTKATPSTQGGSVTLTLTPRQEGPNWIYARTVDGFGNSSDCVLVYSFLVAPPSDPVAHIGFDEGQGDRAADAIDPDRGATLSDGVDWVRGRVGTTDNPGSNPTPRMNGTAVHTSGYTDGDPGPYDQINADYPAVDTSGTFSVSVWVKLDRAYAHHTAVAQEGTQQSAFHLGYQGNTGQWVFKMSPEDEYWDGSRPWASVMSTEPAEIGVWTHLVGTYHEVTRKLTLYVDGVEQGQATHTGGWNATGPLTVGRGLFQGVGNYYWPGSIDDVRVWDRMVYDQAVSDREFENEVWRLANRPVAPQGRWQLDEYDGTEIADSTDHGLDATLYGDPLTAWNLAENSATGSPGVRLNGTDEYIEAPGPALRSDRSFSVAAWVRLDETGQGLNTSAVSQAGTFQSGFHLGYQGSRNAWTFKMAPHDDGPTSGSTGWTYAYSASPARLGEWTHLVGVYDHTRGELILYVNGFEESRTPVDHAWHADGPLRIGSAQHTGTNTYHWSGDVDDVHAYQGVLNERDRDRVYLGEFPNIQI
ncbi:LamG-like jellyroll fold domain-containing protein [Nocardiopsis lambiniae]|uniref:LamG-like jellyroll fold domain-containing protein n=1 Tax=Nocardiopsis lambiniae TaxID=3075539 RepID=A0ABU2MFJ8_9ACTN|nr:LamG-like jellyroll fold domain-containing protein [Nocardiopsis sp. DSM 44743]MDT0331473.1 LamG-like jellyroll fold domain-containing protein [Nocardiopsis sp. DSM 44743]